MGVVSPLAKEQAPPDVRETLEKLAARARRGGFRISFQEAEPRGLRSTMQKSECLESPGGCSIF
jgi:hypothetical protein